VIRQRGKKFQVYVGGGKGKVYLGAYATTEEAEAAEAAWRRNQQTPVGVVAKLRVTAVYGNGVERELHEFDTGCVGMIGFRSDDNDLMVFATEVPAGAEATDAWSYEGPF
jgi:hypothetical protein